MHLALPPFLAIKYVYCAYCTNTVFRQLAVGALLSTLGACVTVMVMILVEDAKCAAKEVHKLTKYLHM
jgi:hypothetical protein